MDEVKIKPYQQSDRDYVFCIAADTAFFGEPVEEFLDDRRLFCDAFVRYYTDYEAEYTWVVCMDDKIVGYLSGCVDTAAQRKRYLIRTIAPLVGRVFQGKYKLGSKTWRFARSMLGGVISYEYPHLNYDEYPAHLHINLNEAACRLYEKTGFKLLEP